MTELVRLDVAGGRATITLDSQHNRNALSRQLLAELNQCIDDAAEARVIVLRHEGPAFCAGADLKERADTSQPIDSAPMVAAMQRLMDAACPTIAAVNGAARAGGIGLMASCDLVVVERSVSFALTEVRIGVAPAIISVPILRRVPASTITAAWLTGEPFGAEQALGMGLVTHVTDDVEAEVDHLCTAILAGGPNAIAAAKRILHEVPGQPYHQAFESMRVLSDQLFRSDEALEGMAAFAEKRPPAWQS